MKVTKRPHSSKPLKWPVNRLKTASDGQLLLLSLAVSGAASALVGTAMSVVFQGRVTWKYLVTGALTGLVAVLLAASIVLSLIYYLRRVEMELRDTTRQLQEGVERQAKDLQTANTLLNTVKSVTTSLDFDEVLLLLANHLREISGFHFCSIYEWNTAETQIRTLAEHGRAIWPPGREEVYRLDDYPTSLRVLESGRSEVVTLDSDPTEAVWLREVGLAAALLIPLSAQGHTVGLVEVGVTRAEHVPDAVAVARCQLIAAEAAKWLKAPLRANADDTLLSLAGRFSEVVKQSECAISAWDRPARVLRSVVEFSDITWQIENGRQYPVNPTLEQALERGFSIVHASDRDLSAPDQEDLERWAGQTMLMLPLMARGRVIGLIELYDVAEERTASDEDIRLWRAVADQAAVAVENARLYHRAQQEISYRKEMQEMFDRERTAFRLIAEVASQRLSLSEVCEGILGGLVQSTGFERGAIRLYDRRRNQLDLVATVGIPQEVIEEQMTTRFLSDQSYLTTYVATTHQPLFAPDMSRANIPPEVRDKLSVLGIMALLSWPLIDSSGSLLGVMHISDFTPHEVSQHDQQFYDTLTRLLTTVLERKIAEEQVEASLTEKEIMLKEIHHRVKNNLQVITSLLNLQSSYIEDEKMAALLTESQTRVRSMALIHEQLYRSDDLARVDFKAYIQELTSYLLMSYHSQADGIRFQIACDEVFLDVTTAIPCGLIINELASNALKYAFPNGRSGVIGVEVAPESGAEGEAQYRLSVWDDGVGFPDGLDFRHTKSLGLQLVNSLTQQLEGSLTLSRENGTAFEIVFAGEGLPEETA
jgi:two-component sensor histidine kinase/GAF domain-containing protein